MYAVKRSALCYNLYSLLVGLSLLLSLTGCPSTPTEERCTGGERRCGDDGNVEECAADGSGFSTSQACTSGQACAEKDGTLQCVDGGAESCQPNKQVCRQNNIWFCDLTGKPSLEIEVCAAGKTCVIEAGVGACKDEAPPVCTAGDKRCASNGMGVEACRADGSGFDLEAACDTGQACSAASGPATCVAAVCAPGEGRCQGASVERCKMDGSGFEVDQTCAADAQCILSNDKPYCAPTSCQSNVRFCYDDNVWECSSSNVPSKIYQSCGDGYVCTRDSGIANCAKGNPDPCTPNTQRCAADGKSIEVCRTDGVNFKPKTECNGEQTCQEVQGVLACADEVCTPNETRCAADATGLERCNTNGVGFRRVNTCSPDESCQILDGSSQCASKIDCTPNEPFCQDNNLWICDAQGKPDKITKSCGTRTCGEVLGKLVCISPEGPCNPGDTRCLPPPITGTAVREQCANDGSGFATIPSCPSGQPRCVELAPGNAVCEAFSCNLGAPRCTADGKALERCASNRQSYEIVQTCAANEQCLYQNSFAVCSAQVCTPNEVVCQGNSLYTCRADGSGQTFTRGCGGTSTCVTSATTGQGLCVPLVLCTPGETRCNGYINRVDVCNAAGTAFEAQTTCASPAQCKVENNQASCVSPPLVCAPNTSFCDGDVQRSCSSSGLSSTPVVNCGASGLQCALTSAGARCIPSTTQSCTPGALKCSSAGEQILVCKADGTGFEQQTNCGSAGSCQLQNNQLVCVAPPSSCAPLSTFCDGAVVRSCNVGGTNSSALINCASSGSQCVIVDGAAQCQAPAMQVCTPGLSQCSASGAQILTCRADSSGLDAQSNCTGDQRCALVNNQPTCQTPAQVCSPSSTFCDGADLRACNAAGTASSLSQSCAATNKQCAIINGSAQCYSPPTQVCTAGQQRCSDTAGQVLVCKADGTGFNVQTSCTTNERCELVNNQPTCQAPPQVCSPSSSFCDGSDVRACNAAGTASSLIQSCAATNRQCAEGAQGAYCYSVSNFACAVGERRCASVGERVEVCKADRSGFEALTTCAASETCQDINNQAACGPDPGIICTANERTCVGTDIVACSSSGRSTFVIQRCANSGGRTCVLENNAPICRSPMITCQPGYRYNGVSCVDLDECGDGTAVCDALCVNTDGGYDCVSSVADATSPYWNSSCTLSQQLNDPTGLQADCRCNTNKSLTGGLPVCWRPFEAYTRWPNAFGQGPRVGAHPQAHIYGGFFDAAAREIIAVVDWSGAQDPDAGFVMGFNVTTGDRRVISGRWLDPATGAKDKGTGVAFANVQDVKRAADGKLYVMGGNLQGTDIVRVDPATGNRTLVWRRGDAAFGQCDNGRGGGGPVQNTSEGFVMDAQGNFYLGFTNTSLVGEGVGIIRISANGAQCSFVSRSGSLGTNTYAGNPVGAGWGITSGNLRGFSIENNELLALNSFDLTLYAINLTTGDRRRVSSASTSSTLGSGPTAASGIGYRWVSYDPTRQVYWTTGRQGDTQIVLVEPNTGNRHELDCSAIDSTYMGVGCIKGALDTGLSLNFGGFWIDPANANIAYFAHDSMGIVMLEIDSGNSVNLSL